MKTQEFLELLQGHQNKALLFQYAPGQLVGANYHITEIKHTSIESVDCGARQDAWNETVVQLWESPSELGKTEYMTVYKAQGIFNKVGRMRNYDPQSEIKFEYGNDIFHTAQLFVNDYEIRENQLILNLGVTPTDCKAKEACGVPETAELATADSCCTPGSGCC